MSAPAVGIDLGTTYSCVAVLRNGEVEVIPDVLGNRTTPSVVAFNNQSPLVGDAAMDLSYLHPQTTVYDAKRMIGRQFNDPHIQVDIAKWPFRVINDGGRPKIQVTHQGTVQTYHPEQISALVLGQLKKLASSHCGAEVTTCVVTVPARFGDHQRNATRDAAKIAGLEVLRIINEPTAAALAYGIITKSSSERNVLIYDLGGGTFDACVLSIEEGISEVLASCGDAHLGGQDFDSHLCEYLADEFSKRHRSFDLREDKRAMRRLYTACDKAKRQLSLMQDCTVQLDNLHANIDFTATVTRARFECLNEDLFRRTITMVDEALKHAKLSKNDIHEVVLVGGSTRIPMVQRLLTEMFGHNKINKSLNPDEAVARGAAIQASILDEAGPDSTVQDVVMVEVAPLSLGVCVQGAAVMPLIPRGAVLPVSKTQTFTTVVDNQASVLLQVFEGERALAKHNTLVGKFALKGLPPRPRGHTQVDVTFELDCNGILNVSAKERSTGISKSVTITSSGLRLPPTELEQLIREAERSRNQDEVFKDVAQARATLEQYCFNVKGTLEDRTRKIKIPDGLREIVYDMCINTIKWHDGNTAASFKDYKRKLKELQDVCDPVIKRFSYGRGKWRR